MIDERRLKEIEERCAAIRMEVLLYSAVVSGLVYKDIPDLVEAVRHRDEEIARLRDLLARAWSTSDLGRDEVAAEVLDAIAGVVTRDTPLPQNVSR